MKNYENKALIKFMAIYMTSSFILFAIVAVMYYFDQRHIAVRELQDEMIAYISLSRNGDNIIKNNNFKLETELSKHRQYPIFYEDLKSNEYISVTCASQYQPDHVFIVSADKSVINIKLYSIMFKITIIMGIGFFIFLALAYYLAKVSIRPIKESRKTINSVIEDILHDLNAPMTAISMNCEALESTTKDEKGLKKIDRIVRSNKTIKFLYNNLSSLLDHPVSLNKEIINIPILLTDRIEFYREFYPESNFELSLSTAECIGDSIAFERIIDNLLSNAIKYSQPNPNISIINKDGKIIIEDNGIGIEDCNAVFLRHYRETEGISNACGLGLGLSIVKKLCDEMGVKIELENNQPKGSRFIIHCT